MIPKAFLSHASTDKDLVGRVAELLGRSTVVYDVYEFATGDDLKQAIMRGLDHSQIFVLFASKNSLARDWVKFEISEAERAISQRTMSQILTFIIDPAIEVADIPGWMRDTVVTREASPALIASTIRERVNAHLAAHRPTYFLGRTAETERALDHLTGGRTDDLRPPLVFYGLPGIGRRTLAEKIGKDALSLDRSVVTRIGEGDLLPELLLKLRLQLEGADVSTVAAQLQAYKAMKSADLVAAISAEFRRICAARAVPILLDEDAMADENGALLPEFALVYEAASRDDALDLFICSNRRLHHRGAEGLPSVRVSELSPESALRLVRLLARDRRIPLTLENARIIAEYSRGYPPAVMFALQEAEIYGPEQVAANRHALSRFNEELFLRQLRKDGRIDPEAAAVLRLLSNYSPLPLPVIQDFLGAGSEVVVGAMARLLDYAFVVPDGINYRISEPIRVAAYREFGGLTVDHALIAKLLDRYLDEFSDDDTRLALSQNVFRASLLSGSKTSKHAVGLASDLINLTTKSYHDQDYDAAIKFGEMAVEERPRSINVRRFVAQALIRREKYDDAEKHIQAIFEEGLLKEGFYVRGFKCRRQGNFREAIENYKKSVEYGRTGVAVHRELASCYFECGDLDQAQAHIKIAEELNPTNRFVVDLKCVIAIKLGDIPAAEDALRTLEKVDESGYYQHRRSSLEQLKGDSQLALQFAEEAARISTRPQFEILANLSNCQIENNSIESAARTLRELDARFSMTHRDARHGLWCKLEIRRGDLDIAENHWRQRQDKDSLVAMGLRIAILDKRQQQRTLGPREEAELDELRARLAKGNLDYAIRMLGSDFLDVE